jgi:serine/threonine-protein kinase
VTGSLGEDSRLIAGRYLLDARIGKGGIAEVWRARHLALNSFVAIKFLQGASAQNESTRRRFTTEAQVTAQLKSQHAVQVFDFGVTEDGHPYLVMELLEGETLGRRIERQGRLAIVETVRILGQSARALQRAHQLGIVHRDFKPENVVIGRDDEGRDFVKVVDFGIAKLVGNLDPPSADLEPSVAASAPSASFTKTGSMLGTPFYMAPEQVRNSADVDLRADIWAFGVVAFECLTGCTPFTGDTVLELFRKIESGKHPEADKLEPTVPGGFSDWFRQACAPDPADRFGDATTAWKKLLAALECGKVDIDPSMTGHALSGGSKRVVVGAEALADGNAITLDAATRKGVEPRQGGPRRTASVASTADAPRSRVSAGASGSPDDGAIAIFRSPSADESRPPEASVGRRPGAWIAVPLLPLAVFVAWRMSSKAPASEPSPASTPSQAASPIATVSAAAAVAPLSDATSSALATAPPPSPSSASAASPKGRSARTRTLPADAAPTMSARPAQTIQPPVAAAAPLVAPSAPAPAPAAASSAADPESYR